MYVCLSLCASRTCASTPIYSNVQAWTVTTGGDEFIPCKTKVKVGMVTARGINPFPPGANAMSEHRLNRYCTFCFQVIHIRKLLYSASQKKRKPKVNFFWKRQWFVRKSLHCYKNSVYPLSYDISYKMYWPCMAKHEQLKWYVKLVCAE